MRVRAREPDDDPPPIPGVDAFYTARMRMMPDKRPLKFRRGVRRAAAPRSAAKRSAMMPRRHVRARRLVRRGQGAGGSSDAWGADVVLRVCDRRFAIAMRHGPPVIARRSPKGSDGCRVAHADASLYWSAGTTWAGHVSRRWEDEDSDGCGRHPAKCILAPNRRHGISSLLSYWYQSKGETAHRTASRHGRFGAVIPRGESLESENSNPGNDGKG